MWDGFSQLCQREILKTRFNHPLPETGSSSTGPEAHFGISRQPQFRTVIHTKNIGLTYAINALLLAEGN